METDAYETIVQQRIAIILLLVNLLSPSPRSTPIATHFRFMGSTLLSTLMRSPDRIWYERFRMSRNSVLNLMLWLTMYTDFGAGCRDVIPMEKLMISLTILAQGITMRAAAFEFGRSESTIHRIFHTFLSSMMIFARHIICSDHPQKPTRYTPYFDDCIGAVDGSYYHCQPHGDGREAFRNRKGTMSVNTMAVVDFAGRFLYVFAGWEGSAHDWRVFLDSITRGFMIPRGKFILGDAGYNNSHRVLTPFRGIRYHLQETGVSGIKPRTPEELYNRRHSSLRIAVEMAFGLQKKWWRVLTVRPVFSVPTMVKIIYATAALTNFILVYDADGSMPRWRDNLPGPFGPLDPHDSFDDTELNGTESGEPAAFRMNLAQTMWDEYARREG